MAAGARCADPDHPLHSDPALFAAWSRPFEIEPYRLFVAVLLLGWLASLLVDSRTRFRKTGFEAPLLLIVGSAVGSVVAYLDPLPNSPRSWTRS